MFDSYCQKTRYPLPPAPDKIVVNGFLSTLSYLAPKSKMNILTMLRQFGLFLSELRYEAYIPPTQKATSSEFTPYIYSTAEIKKLLNSVKHLKINMRSPYMHVVLPTMMRMLYGCGLRISEAVNLLKSDVDLRSGVLTIRESKFERDRLIPMSDSLSIACRKYADDPRIISADSQYFFPAPDGGPLSTGTIRSRFHAMLFKTKIGLGRKIKPRLHDLRHTFAVHCLRQWVKGGQDIMAVLPILATYLGHGDIKCTGRYLRLTAEVFPEISRLMSKVYVDVIPEAVND
jgi:integrase